MNGVNEYDAFGRTASRTGPAADLNPWQFSTKRTDSQRKVGEYSGYTSPVGLNAWPPSAEHGPTILVLTWTGKTPAQLQTLPLSDKASADLHCRI